MSGARVLVVDDHPLFRSGLAHWIRQQHHLRCCGEAESMAQARALVANERPDVVLLDLRLGDGDGVDLVREWSATHPAMRILVLSQNEESVYAHRVLQVGARGYVMKSEATETVLEAISTVLKGQIWISRPVQASLLHNLFPDPVSSSRDLARLSDRELQVFQLLGARLGTREIAEKLGLSPKTVETYRDNLKEKLGQPDAKALVQTATRWVQSGAGPVVPE